MLCVRISIRARCTTVCDKVCQCFATGRWFSPGPPISSTNKTDRQDITEILIVESGAKHNLSNKQTNKQTNKPLHQSLKYYSFDTRYTYLVHYHVYIHFYFNHERLLMLLQEAAMSSNKHDI